LMSSSSSSCMFCCCRRCNSSTTTTYRRPSVRFSRLPSTCSLLKTRPISLSLSFSRVSLHVRGAPDSRQERRSSERDTVILHI
jgi:hypothetical protein